MMCSGVGKVVSGYSAFNLAMMASPAFAVSY
jgi:hypothetical protein